jgi:hypothetical protein
MFRGVFVVLLVASLGCHFCLAQQGGSGGNTGGGSGGGTGVSQSTIRKLIDQILELANSGQLCPLLEQLINYGGGLLDSMGVDPDNLLNLVKTYANCN